MHITHERLAELTGISNKLEARARKAEANVARLEGRVEELEGALQDCRDAMWADNPADGWKEIIENANATLAGDGSVRKLEAERDRAVADCAAMRDALETIAEAHDAGRHDGLPEPCPAHDAETMFAIATEALKDHPGDKLLAMAERESLAEGRDHLTTSGTFQSDKYPTVPAGKVPLSVKDVTAQDLLAIYADRREAVDAEFSRDLREALTNAGYSGASRAALEQADE